MLGGADATHEVTALRDQKVAVVEAASNEHVQLLVCHFGWVVKHGWMDSDQAQCCFTGARGEAGVCVGDLSGTGLCFQ